MKKVLVSILALAMMLSCFCTINVFADGVTPTITAITADNVTVGTYTSISSAASAAGVGGKVVLSAGTFEFNGRQGISVEGITLEGAGKDLTSIVPSSTFKDGSDTNRKALLTIAANNVTVKDLTIDGSVYGDTITAAADFNVVRINSGTGIVLNNIYVTGSPRSLISIGSGSNSATVTATNLFCDAEYKAIPSAIGSGYSAIYSDVDLINSSSLTLNSGAVNGFISLESSATLVNNTTNHYHLEKRVLFVKTVDVTTTTKHFVNSYVNVKDHATSSQKSTFITTVEKNTDIIRDMTDETIDVHDVDLIDNFIILLNDVLESSTDETLEECRDDLIAARTINQ